jgi:uncharacterized membrane protein YkoI
MSRRLLSAIAMLSLLVPAPSLATAPAMAAPTSRGAAAPASRTSGDLQFDERAVRRELELFRAAAISLSEAMAIAEGLHAGARTADISFDGAADASVYRVKTVQVDRVWQHTIDARTGEVMANEIAAPLTELDAEDRNNLAALRAVRHGLSDAVRVAERTTSGKAISGGLMRERGRLNFVIVVVSGADLKEVILEPPTTRRRQ